MKVRYLSAVPGRTGYRFSYPIPRPMVPLYGATKRVESLSKMGLVEAVARAERLAVETATVLAELGAMPDDEQRTIAALGGWVKARRPSKVGHPVSLALFAETRRAVSEGLAGASSEARAASLEALHTLDTVERIATARSAVVVKVAEFGTGTVADLVETWRRNTDARDKEARGKRIAAALKVFTEVIGARRPGAVTKGDVRAFRLAMKDRANGWRFFRDVAHCFALAANDEEVAEDVFQGFTLAAPKTQGDDARRAFNGDEVAALRAALAGRDDDFARIWALLLTSGCRSGEAVTLKRADVKVVEGVLTLTFRKTKTGGDRTIPVHPSLTASVLRWVAEGDSVLLFPHYKGKAPQFQDTAGQWIKRTLSGSTGVTVHSARHRVIQWMLNANVAPRTSRSITGHSGGAGDVHEGVYGGTAPLGVMLAALSEAVPAW